MIREEFVQNIRQVTQQLAKAEDEIQRKIKDLTDAIANADNVDPEIVAAVAPLQVAAQALDDIVPDPIPVPTPTPSATGVDTTPQNS